MRYLLIVALLACTSYAQNTDPSGDWRVNANGSRLSISVSKQSDKYIAYLADACGQRLDSVAWDGDHLEFRRLLSGATQWYRVTIEDGIMIGRFASVAGNKAPRPDPSAYRYHITGWADSALPLTPVVFDVTVNGYQGRLRIDNAGDSLVGRLKFYAFKDALAEGLEEDISGIKWDGERIAFTRARCNQVYSGEVDGGNISGTFTHAGLSYKWSGHRAEVLTYGLTPKTPEDRLAWQESTRRTLYRLMMAGNPAPLSVNVEIVRDNIPPISSALYPVRDDDPANHSQNYTLTELRLRYTLPNWLGGNPITRVVHAYLSKPIGTGPFPLLVAVNGHGGSAYQTLDPGSLFWYGDAFARRGYMVLAVDISHRPVSDRFNYTEWCENGDDPDHGNVAHPSIKPIDDKYFTDWEEDGERVWDVMRGIDYAVSRPDVDASKIVVTGLSMGGEIASYVGALDPRVTVTIPAGFSPDLNVVKYHGNHGCWKWAWADIGDYIDQSDILSLIAPRGLIAETGAMDGVFSDRKPSFSSDKQVIRRGRAAGSIFHFLHPLDHQWRGGIVTSTINDDQTSAETATDGRTLFDWLTTAFFLK